MSTPSAAYREKLRGIQLDSRTSADTSEIAGSSDASCHTSVPPFGFYFYSNPTFSISTAQCQTLRLSWDNTVVYPLQALAFIPGGSAFTIPVPQTRSSLSTNWAVNIREGAQYQIMMADASGTASSGGSTNLTWVTAGTSSCLSPNSPGAGVRVATVISNGVSSTRSLTSLMSSSASSSSSSRAGEGNSGGGSTGSSGPTANAGAIAGGVVGGLAAMALLVFVLFCCRRRRRRAEQQRQDYNDAPSSATPVYQPEMRQAPTSLGPAAAVMRRATRSMGHSRQVSRSSFDILSEPTGVPSTPPRLETPIPADDMPNPFISPFPAPLPLPQSPSEEQPSTQAPVPWGAARGHNKETSTGTLDSLTPEAVARGSMHSGSLVPLNTGPTQNSSLNRNSRKLSGSFGETPPQSPTTRPTPQMRSPVQRAMSSSGLTRWSVDEDSEIGTVRRSAGSGDRLSEVVEGRGPASVETSSPGTTFIQHMDGGPGGVL